MRTIGIEVSVINSVDFLHIFRRTRRNRAVIHRLGISVEIERRHGKDIDLPTTRRLINERHLPYFPSIIGRNCIYDTCKNPLCLRGNTRKQLSVFAFIFRHFIKWGIACNIPIFFRFRISEIYEGRTGTIQSYLHRVLIDKARIRYARVRHTHHIA